jgi:Ni/Fe-hydrogenase subunit HybB-like protein
MNRRVALKTVLWLFVGILATVTFWRFIRGLGATTRLTDAAPWGLWIAFDVMSGVALAAGGFVVAGIVYIFGRKQYRRFARPAILTAFLGYIAVAVGLMYDLGIPLHIWHPIIHPQPHSVLFEVAMCVILYLTVLFLEFAPVVLEHPLFDRPFFRELHRILRKAGLPLVITGIVLSTLHQSSLGSLFLIAPYRVHPLWYSPIIWILFFVSAIGLGFMVVTAEALFSAWYFKHRLRTDLLSGLGRMASIVLFCYLGIRLVDLAVRGTLSLALNGSWQSRVFLLEMSLVLIPAALLASRVVRSSRVGLGLCSLMTILAMIGYRFNVSIVAFTRPEGMTYFPGWIEIVVTVGIISASILVFLFFVEHLQVFDPGEESHETTEAGPLLSGPGFTPLGTRPLLPESMAAPRRYSLAAITGAALALAFLAEDVRSGALLLQTPVSPPLQVTGLAGPQPDDPGIEPILALAPDPGPGIETRNTLFIIDGNRNGRLVIFDHDEHATRLGGEAICAACHHLDFPFRKNTACSDCHRDMYKDTDTFSHSIHAAKLGGNAGCPRCHPDTDAVKSRQNSVQCLECHEADRGKTLLTVFEPDDSLGYASGYMDAMHGLCEQCHKQMVAESPADYPPAFAECATCHRQVSPRYLKQVGPYLRKQPRVG